MKVLTVTNDRELAELIEATLRLEWPDDGCVRVASESDALRAIENEQPNLILLDGELLGTRELDAVREVRELSAAALIVLAKGYDDVELAHELSLGIDDYLGKPFGPLELLTRAKVAIRGHEGPVRADEPDPTPPLDNGVLRLNFAHRRAWRHGHPIFLTPSEFDILSYLVRHFEEVVTYRSLLSHVWGHEDEDATDHLRVYMRRIREKIEDDPDAPQYLLTEHGVGYRFVNPAGSARRSKRSKTPKLRLIEA